MKLNEAEIRIKSYINATKGNFMKVGCILKQIRDKRLFEQDGFTLFVDYLKSNKFEFSERHAFNFIKLHDEFGTLPLENLQSIGISRLIEIANVSDREKQEDLLNKAENLSINETRDIVKDLKDEKLFKKIERQTQREDEDVKTNDDPRAKCLRIAQEILSDLESLRFPLANMSQRIEKWFHFSKKYEGDVEVESLKAAIYEKNREMKRL